MTNFTNRRGRFNVPKLIKGKNLTAGQRKEVKTKCHSIG